MGAEVTFRGGVGVRIYVECIIWTGLHAGFTPDAAVVIKIHDAVRPFEEGSGRADCDARSINAMVASEDGKEPPGIWIFALLDILDPGTKSANRDIVFGLTGDCTSVTADTFAVINQEADFHKLYSGSKRKV
jgi:hypothetical protein